MKAECFSVQPVAEVKRGRHIDGLRGGISRARAQLPPPLDPNTAQHLCQCNFAENTLLGATFYFDDQVFEFFLVGLELIVFLLEKISVALTSCLFLLEDGHA